MILATGAGTAAGPLGLLVVLLLIAGTWFLIRNMNDRIKRLPPSYDEPDDKDEDS